MCIEVIILDKNTGHTGCSNIDVTKPELIIRLLPDMQKLIVSLTRINCAAFLSCTRKYHGILYTLP